MKVTIKGRCWFDKKGVMKDIEDASIEPLDRCAALVETEAKTSMKGGGSTHIPSFPGTPPNVQTGNLRSNIGWAADGKFKRIVGTGRMAWYGRVHEHGSEFGGRRYPPRPFMRPALTRARKKFKQYFKNLKVKPG